MWEQDAIQSVSKQNNLIRKLKKHKINTVYFDFSHSLPSQSENVKKLIVNLGKNNIQVEPILGDPLWAKSEYFSDFNQRIIETSAFIKILPAQYRPHKIHLDIEPHTLPEWSKKSKELSAEFLENLRKIKQKFTTEGIQLSSIIPFWYNEVSIGRTNLSKEIFLLSDEVMIMNYSTDKNAILSNILDEMELSSKLKKKVTVIFETLCNVEPQHISFCNKGYAELERAVHAVLRRYHNEHFAFHEWQSFYTLSATPTCEP